MITHARHKRQDRIVLLALVSAIAIDKCWISVFCPQASGLIGIDPMPVFLDIPVSLSGPIGLLSVSALFIPCYTILIFAYRPPRPNPKQGDLEQNDSRQDLPQQRVSASLWRASTAVLAVPCAMLSGGLIYSLAQDHLPRHIRNAIESFGINADIYTLFPGYELIHLKGSLVILVFFFIGMQICIRRIRTIVPAIAPHGHPEHISADQPEYLPESHAAFIPNARPAQGRTVHDLYKSRNS